MVPRPVQMPTFSDVFTAVFGTIDDRAQLMVSRIYYNIFRIYYNISPKYCNLTAVFGTIDDRAQLMVSV